MSDPVLVALITGVVTVAVALISQGVKRAGRDADAQVAQQVKDSGEAAEEQAGKSARQVGGEMGGIVASAITAAVDPVNARLHLVESELRVIRGDLVPVAVADRDIVLTAVADGLVHRDRVLLIPESVATLYPHHLRHIPHPTPPEESP